MRYQSKSWRTPDISIEKSGIAGGTIVALFVRETVDHPSGIFALGQRTILDAELRNIGMGHLTKQLDTEVQVTRAQGGKVCQVTPVADSYAREAMRRLKGVRC